jgi:hypothetical protein
MPGQAGEMLRVRHRSRDASASESSAGAHSKGPRARRTLWARKTHGPSRLAARRQSGWKNRRFAVSPTPRARCLRLAPRGPRWTEVFYPPLWTSACACPSIRGYGTRLRGPGDANSWRQDRAAWAAARWVCVLHPCAATARLSRLTTPREAPSDGQACAEYEAGKFEGDKHFSSRWSRRCLMMFDGVRARVASHSGTRHVPSSRPILRDGASRLPSMRSR